MAYLTERNTWEPCTARCAAELLAWWEERGHDGPVPIRID